MYRDFGLKAWWFRVEKTSVRCGLRHRHENGDGDWGCFCWFLLVVCVVRGGCLLDLFCVIFDPSFFGKTKGVEVSDLTESLNSRKDPNQNILPLASKNTYTQDYWILSWFHYKWVSSWRYFVSSWVPVGVKLVWLKMIDLPKWITKEIYIWQGCRWFVGYSPWFWLVPKICKKFIKHRNSAFFENSQNGFMHRTWSMNGKQWS